MSSAISWQSGSDGLCDERQAEIIPCGQVVTHVGDDSAVQVVDGAGGWVGVTSPKLGVAKTLRRRLLSLPGRIARTAHRLTLHIPTDWPWHAAFEDTLTRLRALPVNA